MTSGSKSVKAAGAKKLKDIEEIIKEAEDTGNKVAIKAVKDLKLVILTMNYWAQDVVIKASKGDNEELEHLKKHIDKVAGFVL